MSKEVVIADLGLGNLRSVARALDRAGGKAEISADPEVIRQASRVCVPGQGAFRDCSAALERGFREALSEFIASGKPYLGLCLGMQVLFEGSEEAEGKPGMGLFKGKVQRFRADMIDPETEQRLKVPHMGWNMVEGRHPFLPARAYFYFVHSFCCVPSDASLTVGTADYGGAFCAAVARDNVFASQFHPEKSQEEGHLLLTRFLGGQ
jgi:glutamine amidotransferase